MCAEHGCCTFPHCYPLPPPPILPKVSSIYDVIETSHSLAELEIILDNIENDIKHRQKLASLAEAKATDGSSDHGSSADENEEADNSTAASRLSKHRKSIAELIRIRTQVQTRTEVVAQGLYAVKSQRQVEVQLLPFESILSKSRCASFRNCQSFRLSFYFPGVGM